MFGHWGDFERTFAAMDELRRRMEQAWDDAGEQPGLEATGWPRISLWDAGQKLVLQADLPGFKDKDVQVQFMQDTLVVSGERALTVPEGYSVHRQERTPVRFSRSFTLPCRVDGEAITAALKDGVLTLTLPKAPESQPRQIAVKAA